MTVANLAAAFSKIGERVLVVDLDYQGSVSSLFRLEERRQKSLVMSVETRVSTVDKLFDAEPAKIIPDEIISKVNETLHYIPAYYSFEVIERALEYQWTLGVAQDDVRYRLWRFLSSPAIQQSYDRIILDAPPRFTLGFVSGICAATHVFVPMIVDQVSADAVEYFATQFKKLAPAINPALRINGITGTVKNGNIQNTLPKTVQPIIEKLEPKVRAAPSVDGPLFIQNAVVKLQASITGAVESGIPYCVDVDLQVMYDQLAKVIAERAPLRALHESQRDQEAA
jgi:cellulose biosynthesis protein BcsQ